MPSASFQLDGTHATVIDMGGDAIAQIVQLVSASAGTSPPTTTTHVARALWLLSSLTLVVDLSAAFYHPSIGPVFGAHKAAYYGTLAGVLAVVALEMVTAYWLVALPRAGPMLVTFANGLVHLAMLLFLILLAVGGYGLTIKA